jgi:WD40 repeat protein
VWDVVTRMRTAVLTNHAAWVSDVAFSPDERLFASAAADHTIRLWSTEDWRELSVVRGHRDEVISVIFTPDGKRLISGAKNGELKVWPVSHSDRATFLPWPSDFTGWYSVSPDGSIMALCSNQTIRVWSAASLDRIGEIPISDALTNIVNFEASASGAVIAYKTRAGDLKVGRVAGASLKWQAMAMTNGITILVVSPSGKYVAGARRETIFVWTAGDLQQVRSFSATRSRALGFASDDLLVGRASSTMEIWNLATQRHWLFDNAGPVSGFDLLPDGVTMVTSGLDAIVRLWDLRTGRQRELGRTLNAFNSVVAFRDGTRIATGEARFGTRLGYVGLWDPTTGQQLARLTTSHRGEVSAVQLLADGNTLVSAASDGVQVWRAASWEEIRDAENAKNQSPVTPLH